MASPSGSSGTPPSSGRAPAIGARLRRAAVSRRSAAVKASVHTVTAGMAAGRSRAASRWPVQSWQAAQYPSATSAGWREVLPQDGQVNESTPLLYGGRAV